MATCFKIFNNNEEGVWLKTKTDQILKRPDTLIRAIQNRFASFRRTLDMRWQSKCVLLLALAKHASVLGCELLGCRSGKSVLCLPASVPPWSPSPFLAWASPLGSHSRSSMTSLAATKSLVLSWTRHVILYSCHTILNWTRIRHVTEQTRGHFQLSWRCTIEKCRLET